MITVRVRNRDIYPLPLWPITAGSVGLPVSFDFSDEWDGLLKIAIFKAGSVQKEVTLLLPLCAVPHEVLATAGEDLWIGVYGQDAYGNTVMPTAWGKAGYVYDSPVPEDPAVTDETPDWAYQMYEAALAAMAAANAVQTAAQNGEFDGADGQDGEDGFSPVVTITEITGGHRVNITDAEHPVEGQNFDVMDGTGGSGGGGMSATAISLLETILQAAVYTSDQSDNIEALIAELSGGGYGITIAFSGTTATITGLAGTSISYSGTTATIGGN